MTYRGRGSLKVREVECPACGCPNKAGDTRCMYCRAELAGGPSTAIRAALSRLSNLRDFFHPEPSSKRGQPTWKLALSALVSASLVGVGAVFILRGMERGGYFNWTVGGLLVIYGVAALRNAWLSTR